MPTTTELGLPLFNGTDNVTPLATTLNLISSTATSAMLAAVRIQTVANTTARNALVATFNPTAQKPLFVWRADATAGQNIEYTTNGVDWATVLTSATATGWVDCTLASGISARSATYRPQVRRDASGMIHFRGQFNNFTGQTGSTVELCTIPEGFRPNFEQRFMAFQTAVGHNPFGGYVSAAGVMGLQTPTARSPQYPSAHFAVVCPPWSTLGPDN